MIWERLGDPVNYVEPFAGSLAVLLARPTEPRIETVNDLDCVAPETRLLRADMSWAHAGEIQVGDPLLAFDEQNGPAYRTGLCAPTKYRRFARANVTAVRRLVRPSYRLTFDDGTTVVASANHLWLSGSHKSGGTGGGRAWRWLKTSSLVCNRETQRSWVLKVCDVVDREDSFDGGWLSGVLDGEGNISVGPGLRVVLSQNEGGVLDRAQALLAARDIAVTKRTGKRRCRQLVVIGGKHEQLALLMRFRPMRLIQNFLTSCHEVSLYGRDHRAVGLVSKEFLGDQEVVAIETDSHTFIAEGLASHNCYLANTWRAMKADPDAVAEWADRQVNEAELHAIHNWLVKNEDFRERMMTDPDYYDVRAAGYWLYGICAWIGSGWCDLGREKPSRQLPRYGGGGSIGDGGQGVVYGAGIHSGAYRAPSRQLPCLSIAGMGTHALSTRSRIQEVFQALSVRLRHTRVACGDFERVLSDSVTWRHGLTGVLLDPEYPEGTQGLYTGKGAKDGEHVWYRAARWAAEHGDDKRLRIALCGYSDTWVVPNGWTEYAWKARGGYAGQSDGENVNAKRERIWFSPHCLSVGRSCQKQFNLFGDVL